MSEQTTPSPKVLARQIVDSQPEDSTFDELIHELALYRLVMRGMADADAGRTMSLPELRQRVASWRES